MSPMVLLLFASIYALLCHYILCRIKLYFLFRCISRYRVWLHQSYLSPTCICLAIHWSIQLAFLNIFPSCILFYYLCTFYMFVFPINYFHTLVRYDCVVFHLNPYHPSSYTHTHTHSHTLRPSRVMHLLLPCFTRRRLINSVSCIGWF